MDIEAELERARAVHRSGDIAKAVPVYERILRSAPNHPEALNLLAIVKLQTDRPREALALLERAAALAPAHAKIQNNLGTALLSLGRPEDAAERFRMAGDLDSELADAHYNLGNALRGLHRTDDAETAYRRALATDPNHGAAYNNLASVLQQSGRHEEAVEAMRNACRCDPHSKQLQRSLENLLRLSAGSEPTGASSAPRAERQRGHPASFEKNPDTELAEARQLYREGDLATAEKLARNVLRRVPGHPDASFFVGRLLLGSGNAPAAIPQFEAAASGAPESAIAHDYLGQAQLAAGKIDEALVSLKHATELAPDAAEPFVSYAGALEAAGHIEAAEDACRHAVSINPGFHPALTNLGGILHKTGRYREAERVLRKAHETSPTTPEPLANLIATLEAMQKPDEVEYLAKEFLRIAPLHPARFIMQAKIDERAGDLDSALGQLLQAMKQDLPQSFETEVWSEMGRVLDRMGRFDEAFAAFENANSHFRQRREYSRLDKTWLPNLIRAYTERSNWNRIHSPHSKKRSEGIATPFFFVGFPRSGTTLMEQVFGSHPQLVTTNEESPLDGLYRRASKMTAANRPGALDLLTEQQIRQLRRDFVADAREITGSDLSTEFLVDKQPLNIVELGPVEFLFPEAKIIVALRDPRDVCLSCFMQRFSLNQGTVHFLTLESTANLYTQVMSLWLKYREVLSIPWIEYRYEDLVGDFEGTVKRVLDFMGLPWDESVNRYAEHAREREIRTPSRAAVTQAINARAVSRWRNYADQLAPILPVLEPFVRELGYDPS